MIGYLSLREVVEEMARGVSCDESICPDGKQVYRESMAAGQLDAGIQSYDKERPDLFETYSTGFTRKNNNAYSEVESILIYMSSWYMRAFGEYKMENQGEWETSRSRFYVMCLLHGHYSTKGKFKDKRYSDFYEKIFFEINPIKSFMEKIGTRPGNCDSGIKYECCDSTDVSNGDQPQIGLHKGNESKIIISADIQCENKVESKIQDWQIKSYEIANRLVSENKNIKKGLLATLIYEELKRLHIMKRGEKEVSKESILRRGIPRGIFKKIN